MALTFVVNLYYIFDNAILSRSKILKLRTAKAEITFKYAMATKTKKGFLALGLTALFEIKHGDVKKAGNRCFA